MQFAGKLHDDYKSHDFTYNYIENSINHRVLKKIIIFPPQQTFNRARYKYVKRETFMNHEINRPVRFNRAALASKHLHNSDENCKFSTTSERLHGFQHYAAKSETALNGSIEPTTHAIHSVVSPFSTGR